MTSHIDAVQVWMLSPELSVVVLGFIVLGLDLFTKSRALIAWVAIAGLLVPTFFTISLATDLFGSHPTHGFFGMLVVDQFSLFFKFLFLGAGFGVLLVSYGYVGKYLRVTIGEYYSIILLSLAGMMLMASTGELISIYISLELTSIPLYILAGLSRRDARSAEAAVKYVLLGAMSSAILLYGMALLYGATGSTDLSEIFTAATQSLHSSNLLLLAADALIFAGFGFKISAVPFHMWAPDIYEGAPAPSTLFFSVGSKAAGFAAILRVFVAGGLVASTSSYLWVMVAVVAAVTMTLGNVVALLQTNIKRMMAYSSIGQAGYLLVGLAAVMIHSGAGGDAAKAAGNLGILTFLAGIIALADATGRESIRDYDGFGRRSPFIAFGMALCLLSLAGIPPMAGFFSKLFILWSAWNQGSALTWLVVLGLINSAISLVYYVNVIWRMYTVEPAKRDRLSTPRTVTVTMAFSVVAILALTVAFGVLLNSLGAGASSLFTLSK